MEHFWTSDLHFSHKNILSFTERATIWSTVDDMNEGLIERWNSVVKPKDTVTVLGDFAMGDRLTSLPFGQRLNGRKILQPGNHDYVFNQRAKWKPIYEELAGFYGIYGNHMTGTTIGGKVVRQCHFPWRDQATEYDDRYLDEHPVRPTADTILLHGHVHETWKIADHQINVGADVWDCYPVHEDQLVAVCKDMGWMS